MTAHDFEYFDLSKLTGDATTICGGYCPFHGYFSTTSGQCPECITTFQPMPLPVTVVTHPRCECHECTQARAEERRGFTVYKTW